MTAEVHPDPFALVRLEVRVHLLRDEVVEHLLIVQEEQVVPRAEFSGVFSQHGTPSQLSLELDANFLFPAVGRA